MSYISPTYQRLIINLIIKPYLFQEKKKCMGWLESLVPSPLGEADVHTSRSMFGGFPNSTTVDSFVVERSKWGGGGQTGGSSIPVEGISTTGFGLATLAQKPSPHTK